MTATQIIEEIKRLDPKEQLGVIRFVYELDAERRLTGKELSSLAERMITSTDPVEQARVREQIVRGFYGKRKDALDSAAGAAARTIQSSSRSNLGALGLG